MPPTRLPPPALAGGPGRLPLSLPGWLTVCLFCCLLLGSCRAREALSEDLVVPELVRSKLYVSPAGSDSNPGTEAEPFRTLARAAQVVTPGTTVHVAPGEYPGGLRTATSGTPEARIVYQSTVRHRARIVPPFGSRTASAWDNRGDHVDIVGFEIDGSQYQSGTRWLHGIYNGASHNGIRDNLVHHIATDVPCESKGGAGIGVDSYFRGVQAEVTGNRVHDIGPPGCRYVHGIYVSTRAVVRHNIVYRVAGAGIHLWHDASHVLVAGNTVAASGTGIVVGGGDYYHTKGPNDHTQVHDNIVFDNRQGIVESGATGPHNRYRNNLVFQNGGGDWKLARGRRHSGTVAAPPRFVGYSRTGTPDFRLSGTSPAIGRGLTGQSGVRGSGTGPDIGAMPYEPERPAGGGNRR